MVIDCVAGDGHVDGTAQYCSGALPGTRPPPGFVMKVSVLHGHQGGLHTICRGPLLSTLSSPCQLHGRSRPRPAPKGDGAGRYRRTRPATRRLRMRPRRLVEPLLTVILQSPHGLSHRSPCASVASTGPGAAR